MVVAIRCGVAQLPANCISFITPKRAVVANTWPYTTTRHLNCSLVDISTVCETNKSREKNLCRTCESWYTDMLQNKIIGKPDTQHKMWLMMNDTLKHDTYSKSADWLTEQYLTHEKTYCKYNTALYVYRYDTWPWLGRQLPSYFYKVYV